MKKISLVLLGTILPFLVFADEKKNMITLAKNPLQDSDFMAFLSRLGNWVYTFALVGTPIMILIGAFILVTSAGNPEKVKSGRQIIMWSLIGFAIIMLSKGIIVLVNAFLKS
jgi:hypothetical protein